MLRPSSGRLLRRKTILRIHPGVTKSLYALLVFSVGCGGGSQGTRVLRDAAGGLPDSGGADTARLVDAALIVPDSAGQSAGPDASSVPDVAISLDSFAMPLDSQFPDLAPGSTRSDGPPDVPNVPDVKSALDGGLDLAPDLVPAPDSSGVILPDTAPASDAAPPVTPDAGADTPQSPDTAPVSADTGSPEAAVDTRPDLANPGSDAVLAWQPASNVESDVVSWSFTPSIAVEPLAENVTVAWVEASAVKAKRWDRQTGAWGPTRTLQSDGTPKNPSVGTDAMGHIMVAWYQPGTVTDTTLPGIWVSQTSNGTTWSSPQRLVDWNVFELQFAMARNGQARMVFTRQPGTSTNQKGLYTAYYDGSSWTMNPDPLLPLDSPRVSSFGYLSNPQLAISGNGDGIVVFEEYDDNSYSSVGVVNLTGTSRSVPLILDADTSNSVYYMNRFAAMNGNGEGGVTWSQSDGSVYLSFYKPASGWSTPKKLAGTSFASNLGLAIDEQAFVTVTWAQSLTMGLNAVVMRGQWGGTWGEVTPLETDNQSSRTETTQFPVPRLVADSAGNVLAVWKKKVGATTYGAYARRLQGETWQPQVKLGERTGLTAYLPMVAVADSGFGVATFTFIDPTGATTDAESYNVEVAFCR
jgi:hypothetical protein